MQAAKMGERQVFIVAGFGLIIAQLIMAYLGLGGRSLAKSFFWFLKNRYKISLYLCIFSVLICRELFGDVTHNNWYLQLYYPILFFSMASHTWLSEKTFAACSRLNANFFLPCEQNIDSYACRYTELQ